MSSRITVTCAQCGASVEKAKAEINRQLRRGRTEFFCNLSCAARKANAPKRSARVEKQCSHCGCMFVAKQDRHEATFCSKSCASAGSVTDYRRDRARETYGENQASLVPTTEDIAGWLRKREGWKYEALGACLDRRGETYQFEFPLPGTNYIYDLAILDRQLLVEFDGPDHRKYHLTREADAQKTRRAEMKGWQVLRIPVTTNAIIDPGPMLDRLADYLVIHSWAA